MRKFFVPFISAMTIAATSIFAIPASAADYQLEWGDCWSTVADKYNTTMDNLLTINSATADTPLYVGDYITVPDELYSCGNIDFIDIDNNDNTSIIYPDYGDGWYSLGIKTGYTVSELEAANPNLEYPIYGMPINLPTYSATVDYNTSVETNNIYTEESTFIGSRTLYNTPYGNGWYNIKKSAAALNGLRVNAWTTFSFYNYFPDHCGETGGYLWAGAFNDAGGAYGGGICFTSTTLWQTATEVCGMSSVERWNHKYEVSYAPWGRDAAVNLDEYDGARQDMQFYNDLGYDVVFYTAADDNTGALTISAYRCS